MGNTVEMASGTTFGEPRERLDRRAVTLWRITGGISALVMLGIGLTVAFVAPTIAEAAGLSERVQTLLRVAPVAAALLLGALAVGVVPVVRWRRWRYEIRESEVDLQRGALYVTRTLVPMARIQHVDTQQGPLERWLGLSTLIFHTAAGGHSIPAVSEAVADRLRRELAELARLARDEVM